MVQEMRSCPDDKMSKLLASLRAKGGGEMRDLDSLLSDYPNDARLHFLKGSLQAGVQDFVGARVSMRRAVDLAPNYTMARFQLGLLLLTSGEPDAAQETWGPLLGLPADNYLRLFVTGLHHLIRDEFSDAIRSLQEGMAHNQENPVMNRDMQLIIDEVRGKLNDGDKGDAPTSSVNFLLQQAALKSRLH